MPIQLKEENSGKILILQVIGKLKKEDYEQLSSEFERLLRSQGKLRVLFDLTGFHGWETDALWEEVKFDVKHFADIERLAAVGDKKWHHRLAVFFKPFTEATVRYFDYTDTAEARKWLEEA